MTRVIAALSILALAGCTLGPNYSRPEVHGSGDNGMQPSLAAGYAFVEAVQEAMTIWSRDQS